MKKTVLMCVFLLSLITAGGVSAASPELKLPYQKKLTVAATTSATATPVTVKFSLYDADTFGTKYWEETKTISINSATRLISTTLGDTGFSPLDPAAFSNQLWVQVEVNGVTIGSRDKLAVAPYAIWSAASDVPGVAGPQGPMGDKGDTGNSIIGPQGPAGLPGAAGAAGPTGLQGPKGDTGLTGSQGLKGDTGLAGAQGLKGDTSLTGPTGPQGSKGDTGLNGPAGSQGPQGIQGLTGATGPAGAQGNPGVTDCAGGRFEDNNDGTVTDCRSGLVWLKDAACLGTATFAGANSAAAALQTNNSACGLSDGSSAGDWRLPTKTEWMNFVASARKQGFANPALTDNTGTAKWREGYLFKNVQSYNYWSSNTYAFYTYFAWYVSMDVGNVYYNNKAINDFYVWPVRSGQ